MRRSIGAPKPCPCKLSSANADVALHNARLDHMLGHMVRLRPDGSKLTWRVATMSKFDEPGRAPKPFFITWDDPALRPDKVRSDGRSSL